MRTTNTISTLLPALLLCTLCLSTACEPGSTVSTDSASPGPADVVAAVDASGCTTSAECDDDNICTDDTCTAGGYCKHVALSGLSCNDGNACTEDDRCTVDAICAGTSAVSCDDGNPCTDGDACDALGKCKSGPPHQCVSQHPCRTAWCNEQAKENTNPCVLEWKSAGVGCDDGDLCTTEMLNEGVSNLTTGRP